jgi:hypothetical protein
MRGAVRPLVIAVLVAVLAGVGVANVVLLGYGADRNDPVGRLSPVLPVSHPVPTPAPAPAPATTVPTTTEDHHGGRGGPDD